MEKIVEIIPDNLPEWAQEAIDGGRLFAACLDKINKLESKTIFPMSHEACDAFWGYWKENGETHKHGYYESTWGSIQAYLDKAATTKDQRTQK